MNRGPGVLHLHTRESPHARCFGKGVIRKTKLQADACSVHGSKCVARVCIRLAERDSSTNGTTDTTAPSSPSVAATPSLPLPPSLSRRLYTEMPHTHNTQAPRDLGSAELNQTAGAYLDDNVVPTCILPFRLRHGRITSLMSCCAPATRPGRLFSGGPKPLFRVPGGPVNAAEN